MGSMLLMILTWRILINMPYPGTNKTFGRVINQAIKRQINDQINTFLPAKITAIYADEMRIDARLKFKKPGEDALVMRKIPVVFARGGNSGYLAPLKIDDIVLIGFSKYDLQTLLHSKSIPDQSPGKHGMRFFDGPFAIAGFVLWDEVGKPIFEVGSYEQVAPDWEIPTDGPKQVSDENYLLHARKYIKLGGDSLWVWDDIDYNSLCNPNLPVDLDRAERILGTDAAIGRKMDLGDVLYGTWLVPATWNRQRIDVFVEIIANEPNFQSNNIEFLFDIRQSKSVQVPDSNPLTVQVYVQLSAVFVGYHRYRGVNNPSVTPFSPPDKWYSVDFSLKYNSAQHLANTVYVTRVIFRSKCDQIGWAKNFEVIS